MHTGMEVYRVVANAGEHQLQTRRIVRVNPTSFTIDTPFTDSVRVFVRRCLGKSVFATQNAALCNFAEQQRRSIRMPDRRKTPAQRRKIKASALHAIDWATAMLDQS